MEQERTTSMQLQSDHFLNLPLLGIQVFGLLYVANMCYKQVRPYLVLVNVLTWLFPRF